MTIWFSKKINGQKRYCSKSIMIKFYPQHWRFLKWHTNGAKPGDKCYDLNIWLFGLLINYTNWDYNS